MRKLLGAAVLSVALVTGCAPAGSPPKTAEQIVLENKATLHLLVHVGTSRIVRENPKVREPVILWARATSIALANNYDIAAYGPIMHSTLETMTMDPDLKAVGHILIDVVLENIRSQIAGMDLNTTNLTILLSDLFKWIEQAATVAHV